MVNSGFMRQSGAVPIMLAISEGFACTVTSAFLDFLHTGVQRQGKKDNEDDLCLFSPFPNRVGNLCFQGKVSEKCLERMVPQCNVVDLTDCVLPTPVTTTKAGGLEGL